MLTKRIIPCLDIRDGRTVKGINFESIRDAGDPVELARLYAEQGADELVFLDITATVEKRTLFYDLVERIGAQLNIPFTVGGGISSKADVSRLLQAGAEKVSINSAAVRDPARIKELAGEFGSQCVVVAIDTKCIDGEWYVFLDGGRTKTERRTLDWAREAESLGAGEILLTSMNHDGTKDGFALEITRAVSRSVDIPVIASGGAGKPQHFVEVLSEGGADAALAASIFHYQEITIPELKRNLRESGLCVRL
ncbi:MAG: imidazole glycerol phosphate synthase subunit HisF [Deltaproteobacteria bacterium]|nr:imidazole glycerol phosphate synthase subunit HisF [Deltaproteobacteria bacterium]